MIALEAKPGAAGGSRRKPEEAGGAGCRTRYCVECLIADDLIDCDFQVTFDPVERSSTRNQSADGRAEHWILVCNARGSRHTLRPSMRNKLCLAIMRLCIERAATSRRRIWSKRPVTGRRPRLPFPHQSARKQKHGG